MLGVEEHERLSGEEPAAMFVNRFVVRHDGVIEALGAAPARLEGETLTATIGSRPRYGHLMFRRFTVLPITAGAEA
jgi:hypothetical protein